MLQYVLSTTCYYNDGLEKLADHSCLPIVTLAANSLITKYELLLRYLLRKFESKYQFFSCRHQISVLTIQEFALLFTLSAQISGLMYPGSKGPYGYIELSVFKLYYEVVVHVFRLYLKKSCERPPGSEYLQMATWNAANSATRPVLRKTTNWTNPSASRNQF